jgi:hypothetical protein
MQGAAMQGQQRTGAADAGGGDAGAAAAAAKSSKSPQRSPLPPLRWLTPAELLAKELQLSVRGMGAATAAALAATTALGGVRHSSLAGLKQWLAADEGHQELLKAFLHEGEFVAAWSRQCQWLNAGLQHSQYGSGQQPTAAYQCICKLAE